MIKSAKSFFEYEFRFIISIIQVKMETEGSATNGDAKNDWLAKVTFHLFHQWRALRTSKIEI